MASHCINSMYSSHLIIAFQIRTNLFFILMKENNLPLLTEIFSQPN
jgi:hypothetical protein